MLGMWKAPLYVTEPTMDALQRTLPDTFGKRLRGVEKFLQDNDLRLAILTCTLSRFHTTPPTPSDLRSKPTAQNSRL